MAVIRPFHAVRPTPELAHLVAALPYDVMNTEEAREMVKGNPHSFLRIDRGEVELDPGIDVHDPKVYAHAKEKFDGMRADGRFVTEETACLYLYRLIREGRAQTGLAATVSVAEYENNIIKKHELTRADKEQDRIDHVNTLNAQTGPIFLTYRDNEKAAALIADIQARTAPMYDFVAEDGVAHTVWKIDGEADIETLKAVFGEIPNLYIADGHHRNASAARVAKMRREANPDHRGDEGYNFYLAVLFPDSQLEIMDYNRVVRDLNGRTQKEFLTELEKIFHILPAKDSDEAKPKAPATFGMYLGGKWYTLIMKEKPEGDCVERLDVSILQSNVLIPVLGIGDVRTDKRIDFVGGIRGLGELERRVDSGEMAVAFAMYPTSLAELMEIADEGRIMPPKSTWFEPKLRSGLLMHLLDD